jgi:hypothetical protein
MEIRAFSNAFIILSSFPTPKRLGAPNDPISVAVVADWSGKGLYERSSGRLGIRETKHRATHEPEVFESRDRDAFMRVTIHSVSQGQGGIIAEQICSFFSIFGLIGIVL